MSEMKGKEKNRKTIKSKIEKIPALHQKKMKKRVMEKFAY